MKNNHLICVTSVSLLNFVMGRYILCRFEW